MLIIILGCDICKAKISKKIEKKVEKKTKKSLVFLNKKKTGKNKAFSKICFSKNHQKMTFKKKVTFLKKKTKKSLVFLNKKKTGKNKAFSKIFFSKNVIFKKKSLF